MNLYLIVILIFSIVTLSLSQQDIDIDDEEREWEEFKRVYEKSYSDEKRRREIWSQNRKHIAKVNLKRRIFTGLEEIEQLSENGFTLKMNKYGDLTPEEFRVLLNGFKVTKHYEKDDDSKSDYTQREVNDFDVNEDAPISIDWRNSGYVTGVRDQGMCGCCYIFAASAALEGQYAKQYGKLVSISDQNFMNCVKSGYFVDRNGVVEPLKPGIIQAFGYSSNGCNGGNADSVFQFNKYNGFLPLSNVPYKGTPGTCNQTPNYSYLTTATNAGFKHVFPSGSETALVNAVASIGPIAVGIQGNLQNFQYYSSGIYNDPSCTSANINHAVTVVGYGTLGPGQDYYIIKNSWGTSWGMKGYGYIARNKGNMCGIASYASYPLL